MVRYIGWIAVEHAQQTLQATRWLPLRVVVLPEGFVRPAPLKPVQDAFFFDVSQQWLI